MPGRRRRPEVEGQIGFDDVFRDAWMGDRVLQGDREENALPGSPQATGNRPIAPNAGEFDAISITDDDLDEGAATEATGEAAPITLVPTSTTNPKRPRTVAAGYMPSTKTLSTIFRDGTLYNYYEVTSLEWSNFKRARSKGRFILTYLDQKPRGYPDNGPMSLFARASLDAIRAAQIQSKGFQPGQSTGSRRGARGTYRPGNLGGTTRGRG